MDFKYLKADLLAGLVVFFVAVPLCLGIAVASGAPPISGLIAGMIGGIVIGFISKSEVSVSGPAAGLVAIVIAGISSTGSLAAFGLGVLLAGVIQIIFGFMRAGTIAYFFPSAVIKGMLTAIGIIIIIKQLPHFVGYDKDYEGDLDFFQTNQENTFSSLLHSFNYISFGVLITGVCSILAIIFWDKFKKGPLTTVPGAIVGIIVGLLCNEFFKMSNMTDLIVQKEHLVQIPVLHNFSELSSLITLPDFSAISNKAVWILAITIALVASIETLLTIEATDKIDPLKRVTPTNHELIAQGIGNTISGFLGGLPITSVIVRSSANINSGGKTKIASIFHGVLILVGTFLLATFLNLIPLTSLAAILLITGWKLAHPKNFIEVFKKDMSQWLPFIVTVVAIVFTDLLIGIGCGMFVSIIFLLVKNLQNSHYFGKETVNGKQYLKITLSDEISFLNKASMLLTLDRIKENSNVIIDADKAFYIDYDVLEIIKEFATEKAPRKGIHVVLRGFHDGYGIQNLSGLRLTTT